jgi:hypothetical protein
MLPPSQNLAAKALVFGVSLAFASQVLAVPPHTDHIGDVYEITRDVRTSEDDGKGSSGSSTDHDVLIEHVIQIHSDGLELEYSLPVEPSAQERASDWRFPLRVKKPLSGAPQLVNQTELDNRIDEWLTKAGLSRTDCGHWVFTWTAVKIECDAQSALQTIQAFDLRINGLHEGALYQDPDASASMAFKQDSSRSGGASFIGEAPVDPDRVRKAQAESDVVLAEIMKRPLTLDDALRARSNEDVSGSVSITIDVNSTGSILGRTKVIKLKTSKPNGAIAQRITTEIVKRRMISEATSP